MAESELFEEGLRIRREVLGTEYVDGSIARADDFMMSFQRVTTEWCWGYTWGREGLDREGAIDVRADKVEQLRKAPAAALHLQQRRAEPGLALADGVPGVPVRQPGALACGGDAAGLGHA